MLDRLTSHIQNSSAAIRELSANAKCIEKIVTSLVKVSREGGTIYAVGNGGSACQAMHLSEELLARYKRERPGIKALHLCDSGTITCWSNDYSFVGAFARQVETLGESRDALIVLSTSGNSANIVQALEAAGKRKMLRIGLLGKDGGKAVDHAELAIVVKHNETAHIQEAHLVLLHLICDELERALYFSD